METNLHQKVVVVDLARFTETGARVFAGQRWGQGSRKAAMLDDHDRDPAVVVHVRVPTELIALDSSFCRGMFGPSIKLLKDAFRTKYLFKGDPDRVSSLEASVLEIARDARCGPTRLRIFPTPRAVSAGEQS